MAQRPVNVLVPVIGRDEGAEGLDGPGVEALALGKQPLLESQRTIEVKALQELAPVAANGIRQPVQFLDGDARLPVGP